MLHYYAPTLEFVLHIIFPKHRNFGSPYLTDSAYPYSHVGLCHLITKFTIPSYNYLSFGVYEIELSFSLTRNLSIVFSKKKKSLYISTNTNSLLGDEASPHKRRLKCDTKHQSQEADATFITSDGSKSYKPWRTLDTNNDNY